MAEIKHMRKILMLIMLITSVRVKTQLNVHWTVFEGTNKKFNLGKLRNYFVIASFRLLVICKTHVLSLVVVRVLGELTQNKNERILLFLIYVVSQSSWQK